MPARKTPAVKSAKKTSTRPTRKSHHTEISQPDQELDARPSASAITLEKLTRSKAIKKSLVTKVTQQSKAKAPARASRAKGGASARKSQLTKKNIPLVSAESKTRSVAATKTKPLRA